MTIRVYTDGAFSTADGNVGGWAWAISETHYRCGSAFNTTNNRMELMAVLHGMLTLYKIEEPLTFVSDSQYVVNAFNAGWLANWQASGWMNSGNKPVANRDIWERLASGLSLREFPTNFEWVRGHSGNPMNDLVDRLAVEQRKRAACAG